MTVACLAFALASVAPPRAWAAVGSDASQAAQSGEGHAGGADANEQALAFFEWLESHARDFGRCEPSREEGSAAGPAYVLCDNTRVPQSRLRELFALKPAALKSWIAAQGLKVEILCDPTAAVQPFADGCAKRASGKSFTAFKAVTALHGQYLPEERTILIRSSASPGSLIHEYLHSLEAANTVPIYGHVYKRERVDVQRGIRKEMDARIAETAALEARGRKHDAAEAAKAFTLESELLRHFALWQDLIDERSLFMLYLRFGSEFGAAEDDLALARKNMGFICQQSALRAVIPASECP